MRKSQVTRELRLSRFFRATIYTTIVVNICFHIVYVVLIKSELLKMGAIAFLMDIITIAAIYLHIKYKYKYFQKMQDTCRIKEVKEVKDICKADNVSCREIENGVSIYVFNTPCEIKCIR